MTADISHIYETIDNSNITFIGYTYKVERIKDEFISKLPCVKLGEIDSSFSFKVYMRDSKINQILGDGYYFKYIVLNIADIRLDNYIHRSNLIKRIISDIREDMYKLYSDEKFETAYKLIVTAPGDFDINNFTGGSGPLYMADFAFVIKVPKLFGEPSIKILKNRNGIDNNEVSLDNLTNYKYICKHGQYSNK
jgi:hypothetical protein